MKYWVNIPEIRTKFKTEFTDPRRLTKAPKGSSGLLRNTSFTALFILLSIYETKSSLK